MDEGYTSEEGWHRETQSVKKKKQFSRVSKKLDNMAS